MATLDFSLKEVGDYTWVTCHTCDELLVLPHRMGDEERDRFSRWVAFHLTHVYIEEST